MFLCLQFNWSTVHCSKLKTRLFLATGLNWLTAFNRLRGKEAQSREVELSLNSEAGRNYWSLLDRLTVSPAQKDLSYLLEASFQELQQELGGTSKWGEKSTWYIYISQFIGQYNPHILKRGKSQYVAKQSKARSVLLIYSPIVVKVLSG